MSDQLTERLNRILPKLISGELLSGSGLGNEIGFYVFDYPAEDELRVREHIQFLLDHLPKSKYLGMNLPEIMFFMYSPLATSLQVPQVCLIQPQIYLWRPIHL